MLNRPTGKSYSGSCGAGGASVTYGYDYGQYGRGYRTSMSDGSGSTSWSYDIRGRLRLEEKTITGSGRFTTEWSYNSADLVEWMKYPDDNLGNAGEKVTYNYHPQMLVKYFHLDNDTDPDYFYLQSASYDAAGRPDQLKLGADTLLDTSPELVQDYDYFAWNTLNGMGRLKALKTQTGGTPTVLQDLRYYSGTDTPKYDAAGNLLNIYDYKAGNPQTQTFQYDSLHRLTSASASGGTNGNYSESYTYNSSTGNLDTKLDNNYLYNPGVTCSAGYRTLPHAVATAGSTSYTYDCNGNMTRRDPAGAPVYNFTYDAENHLVRADGTNQDGVAQESGGMVVIEAEKYWDKLPRSSHDWVLSTAKAGYSGTGAMFASPNNGSYYDPNYTTTSPEMRFQVEFHQTGTYYVWMRVWADSGGDNSAHAGLDDQAVSSADRIHTNTLGAWVWTKATSDGPVATLNVAAPGVHVVNIWAREDGLYIDRIVLTRNALYTPSGTGPAESVRGPVYVYDGDGNRVRAVEAGSVTAYVGSWYESVRLPGDATPKTNRYYYAGSQRLAMRKDGELYFLVGDHLGSTSLSYKAGRSDTDTQTYKAWGELRWPTTSALPTDRTYTGQRSEVEGIGLLYYGARWYDPALSRWAQPDSIIPNPLNPLDWDRFAYVRSNPSRYIDPTGHLSEDQIITALGVRTWEEVLAYFEEGGIAEGKWGWLIVLRAAELGDTIFYTPDYYQAWHPPTRIPLGILIEVDGQILLQTDSGALSLLDVIISTPEGEMIGVEHPRPGGSYIMFVSLYANPYHLQWKDWDDVDKLDLAVDLFGLVGDVAFLFPPVGTVIWVFSEIPEFLTVGKPWDQLEMGDPSGVLIDTGISIAQIVRLIPEGGWIGNIANLAFNLLEITP